MPKSPGGQASQLSIQLVTPLPGVHVLSPAALQRRTLAPLLIPQGLDGLLSRLELGRQLLFSAAGLLPLLKLRLLATEVLLLTVAQFALFGQQCLQLLPLGDPPADGAELFLQLRATPGNALQLH